MARIAGVDIPRDKQIWVSLTYIYGIGPTTAYKILARTTFRPIGASRDLTEDEVTRLREIIDREYHGRRRSAPRGQPEHQAVDGNQLLPRRAPPPRPARPRPAHAHQRPHAARARARPWPAARRPRRRSKPSMAERRTRGPRGCACPPPRTQERAARQRLHPVQLQQHHRHHHRSRRQRAHLGLVGRGRLQGLAQEHAVRGWPGRR